MKHIYGFFFFLDRNIDGNEKSFPPFQGHVNDAVTEQSLTPNGLALKSAKEM